MSFNVVVTARSEFTFDQNLIYLAKEWDNKTINKFLDRVDDVIQKIKENPFLFPVYEKNIRKAIINKRIILYYRIVDDNTIQLLVFHNTYHNPDNLKV